MSSGLFYQNSLDKSISNSWMSGLSKCAFEIFQKVIFCLAFYTEEVNENFCHDLMQNHLLQLNVPMYKKFYSSHCFFLKNQIFSLFPIVKMNANYAEICRVINLEADSASSIFLKFSHYCCETSIIQIQQREVKYVYLDKNSKKSINYRNCTGQTNYWPYRNRNRKDKCF